jgi:hypothetical protein
MGALESGDGLAQRSGGEIGLAEQLVRDEILRRDLGRPERFADRTALRPELASAGAEGWEFVFATAMFNTLMTKVVYTRFLKRTVS